MGSRVMIAATTYIEARKNMMYALKYFKNLNNQFFCEHPALILECIQSWYLGIRNSICRDKPGFEPKI